MLLGAGLVFNDGPWRWLRGNKLGAYKLSHFNPYGTMPKVTAALQRLLEYSLWGSVQWCVKLLPERRRGSRNWARPSACQHREHKPAFAHPCLRLTAWGGEAA